MKRSSLFIFALASIGGLGLLVPVRAQDTVQYFDKAKNAVVPVSGKIQTEDPSKIVLKPTVGANREIPANEVIDVSYEIRPALIVDYNGPRTAETQAAKAITIAERRKQWQTALQKYKDFRPKVEEKAMGRHVDYKIAYLTARLAEDDATQRDAAVEALTKFKTDHPDGWQVSHASKMLAGLLMEKGSFVEAQKIYEDLSKLPLGKELKQEADMLAAQAMIRSKDKDKVAEAEKRLLALLQAMPETDPQTAKVKVFLSECKAGKGLLDEAARELDAVIDKTTDPNLKALARNTLGDCFRANNKPRDALWQYLWVDVVYNQDKQEHIKAVTQLAKLFEELKDDEKAKQYKDKLATLK